MLAFALAVASGAHASQLTTSPASLLVTAQEGRSAQVSVDAAPGVTWLAETNVGSIGGVTEPEPGHYVATLTVPPHDMPRAALVVFSPQNREDLEPQWAIVSVGVRTTLSARTEARSRVSAEVGGRTFGPVEAGRDGAFTLDIELPPGARDAQVHLQDVAGNVTTTTLPVPQRAHDPLTVILDRYRLTSDGKSKARVFAFAFDDSGRPLREPALTATASAGEISAFEPSEPGLWTATYVAPKDGREGFADVTVSLASKGAKSPVTELDRVALVRGLPGSLKIAADPLRIVAGRTRSVAVTAAVTDSAGNPLPGQALRFFADRGELSETIDRKDGSYATTLTPPALVESGSIEVKALLPVGGPAKIPAKLVVTADPKTVPTSWRAFSLITAQVLDEKGDPVAGEIVLFHLSRGEGTVTPAAMTLSGGQAFADFAADPTEEVVTVEAVSTTTPSLHAEVSIQKRREGQFAIVTRPASVAMGGQSAAVLVLADDKRLLQDAILLEMVAGAPERLVASADPTRLVADGQSQSRLTARLLDSSGNEVREQPLQWSTDRGSVAADSETDDGVHESAFTSPEGRGSGRALVSVKHAASGLSATLPIDLDVGPAARIALVSDKTEMPADGVSRATLTATVQDASGTPVPDASVRFEITGGDASVDPSATTGSSGTAGATLLASMTPGPVTVAATTAEGLSASVDVNLLALRPERLTVTADPARIRADGRDRSEILAIVEDGMGRRLENEPLTFRVAGRASLTAQRVRSNADGEARAYLSGAVAETARVTVTSDRAPGLHEDASVELVADSIPATIVADSPACSAGVHLAATADGATQFQWDWTGDGVSDGAGPVIVAAMDPGPHEIVLTVSDASGRTGTARATITVGASPHAVIDPPPVHVASGASVQLDGSSSSVAAGAPHWSWDLDGDGGEDGDQPQVEWTGPDGLRTAVLTITDDAGCVATATAQVLFGDPPDLSTSLTVRGATTIAPTEAATLDVGWANAGPAAATSVQLVLALGGPATIVESSLPAGSRLLGDAIAVFDLGTIGSGASGSFAVQVVASQDFPGNLASVVATSRIASPLGDALPTNDSATATISVARNVDLRVTLRCPQAGPFGAGDKADLYLDVTNASISDAPDVSAQIAWDDALFRATGLPLGSVPGQATFDVGALPAGASRTLHVAGSVRDALPLPQQDLVVTGRAFSSGADTAPADNVDRVTRTILARPDLAVTLEASPIRTPLLPGDSIDYVATWSNHGTTAATDVTVVSVMTAGTLDHVTNNPGGSVTGDRITFSLRTVRPGESGRLRWTAVLSASIPASLTSECNDVSIDEPAGLDIDPSDDADSRCVAVDVRPSLAITLSAPPSANAGDPATYTVTVSNSGSTATGVELELRLSGALAASGGPASDPLVLRTTIGQVDRGTPRTWRPQVVLACPQATRNPPLDAIASVLVSGTPTGATATHRLGVVAEPDVAASLALPASASAGDTIAGTLTLTNVGCAPCDAAGATLTWPATLASGSPVTLGGAALPVGAAQALPFSIAALAQLPAETNVLDVLAAASCAGDSDAANDAAAAHPTLLAMPDVEVTQVDAPATLGAGQSADVVVHVRNSGTTAANGVVVSLGSSTAALFGSITPASVTIPSLLGGGATATATFRVVAAPTLPAASQPADLTGHADFTDADPSDDAMSALLTLTAAPDLAVSLGISTVQDPPLPGSVVTITATITNVGTTISSGATLDLARDGAVLLDIGATTFPDPLPNLAPGAAPLVRQYRFVLVSPLPAGVDLTHVAAHVADALDANASNDDDARDLRLGAVVDLGVDLTLTPDSLPLRAGGTVLVTVKTVNDGGRDALPFQVDLTWPAQLIASATGPAPADTTAGRMSWTIPGLAAHAQGTPAQVRLLLSSVLPATVNPLDVDVSLVSDPVANPENDLSDNQDADGLTAMAESDLCATMTATTTPTPAAPGGSITYAVALENRGTTAAHGATLSLVTDPWLGAPTSGTATWTIPQVDPGAAPLAFSAGFAIPAFAPGETSRVVTASATTAAPEEGPGGCPATSASVRTSITTEADLTVDLSVRSSDDPPRRGSTLTYSMIVRNVGNSDAIGGSLTNRYPPETSIDPSVPGTTGGYVPGAGNVTWSLPTVPAGASLAPYVFSVRVNSLAPGAYVLHDEAQVSAAVDADASNDLATRDLPMNLDVDLAVAMTCVASPAPATPGSVIECTGTVTNDGSYPASNPRLIADASSLGVLDGLGTQATTIALAPSPLPPRGVAPFTFRVRSLAVLPACANVLPITARAQSTEPDADVSDNVASANVSVGAWTDLHADLVATDVNGAPLVAGDRIDFRLTLSNAGTMPASPVALAATYDASLLDLVPGGDLSGAGGSLTGTLAAPLQPGTPAVATWSLIAKAQMPSTDNVFTACASGAASCERSPNDDRACVGPLTILAWPNLVVSSLTASAPTTPAAPGDVITYSATVENRGTTTATGVKLTDDRRDDLTTGLTGAVVPAADVGGVITMSLPDLVPGASTPVTWSVALAPTMPAPDTIVPTTACASATQPDQQPADDCASTSVAVRATVDAHVEIVATPAGGTCGPGAQVSYAISVSNLGRAPAPSPVLTLLLPPEVSVQSAPGSHPVAGGIAYDLAPLAPAAPPIVLNALVRVAAILPDANNTISATARIAHGAAAFESNPSDDSASASLSCPAWADVVAQVERTSGSPGPGTNATYRVTVRNDGSTIARAVQLVVTDDATILAPFGPDPGSMGRTYALGDIPAGATAPQWILSYTVLPVLPQASNTLVERVTASTTTPEQDLSDNVYDKIDVVAAQADLWTTIALSAPTSPASPNDVVTATIDYGNAGETASVGTLAITLDPNAAYVQSSVPPRNVAGQVVTFDLGSIPAGTQSRITLTFRIAGVMPSPATNVLALSTVASAVADQDASNDADLASVLVAAAPDLRIDVSLTPPASAAAGGTIDGTISVTNAGTTRATSTGVTLRPLESDVVESAQCLDGPCSASGATLTWLLGQVDVAPGAPIVKRFRLTMKTVQPNVGNPLTIEGRTYCNESEPNTADNVDQESATVTAAPDLKLVSMTPSSSVVRPGTSLDMTYSYVNVGSAPANPAELEVTFDPAQLTPINTPGAVVGTGSLTYAWASPLQPGSTATHAARFSVVAAPPPPTVRDVAQHAVARERAPLLLTRDANPADNAGDLVVKACYISVKPFITSSRQLTCMGSGVSIMAESTPDIGVTYSWFAEGGLGRFSSTTTRTTTFFPPTTPGSVVYRIHVVVADVTDPSCTAEGVVSVVTDPSCVSCGCSPTAFNVQYDAAFSRWDRYGDKSATQGETVAFRVQLRTTNASKSGWLLGGDGNTRMFFTAGGATYTAWLSGDVWVECNQQYIVQFGPAVVPANMPTGYQAIRFEFVTRDECGHPIQRDLDNNTGDRVQILAAPLGNGITFTDWGPIQTQGR